MSIVARMLARRTLILGSLVLTLFVVLAAFAGISRAEQLVSSWYGVGDGFAGQTTANGEIFDPYAYTAAHKTLPFDTKLEVTYGGESVVVRVNDRGPYITGRDLDLSYVAARDIGLTAVGSAPVEVEYVSADTPVGPTGGTTAASGPEPAPRLTPETAPGLLGPEDAPQSAPAPAPAPQSAPEPALEPAPQFAPAPTPAPEPAPEPATDETSRQAAQEAAPEEPAENSVGESAGSDQYPTGEQYEDQAVGDEQYADEQATEERAMEEQYAEPQTSGVEDQYVSENAGGNQYDNNQNAGPKGVEPVESEDLPAPPPAMSPPPVKDLEEPPAELVKPGSTIDHRIELGIAAKLGTATAAPNTPDPAPEPAEESAEKADEEPLAPGDVPESEPTVETPEAQETQETQETTAEPKESSEPKEDREDDVEIARLPDTGGPAILSSVSGVDLIAVLLVAGLIQICFKRLKA